MFSWSERGGGFSGGPSVTCTLRGVVTGTADVFVDEEDFRRREGVLGEGAVLEEGDEDFLRLRWGERISSGRSISTRSSAASIVVSRSTLSDAARGTMVSTNEAPEVEEAWTSTTSFDSWVFFLGVATLPSMPSTGT